MSAIVIKLYIVVCEGCIVRLVLEAVMNSVHRYIFFIVKEFRYLSWQRIIKGWLPWQPKD